MGTSVIATRVGAIRADVAPLRALWTHRIASHIALAPILARCASWKLQAAISVPAMRTLGTSKSEVVVMSRVSPAGIGIRRGSC